MEMEAVSFEDFCADPQLINEPISKAWATFYRAIDGLPLDEEGEELFRRCTGRDDYEFRVFTEATCIAGRRSEKTSSSLKYLLWKALFSDWSTKLRRSWFSRLGRHTTLLRIPIVCQDMRVAQSVQGMAESYVMGSPVLSNEVSEVLTRELIFKNGIALATFPASKASVRGLTCPAALLDELAFVSVEGASDAELVRQVKPALLTFGQSRRLIKLSTPWQKSGVIYDEFSKRQDRPDLLIWQASTQTMTPRIDAEELERERIADPIYFSREFGAEFSSDIDAFLPASDIEAAVQSWRELAPDANSYYVACLDASGLSGGDRFCFGIAHSHANGVAVDCLRGWKRGAVGEVLDEIKSLCTAFRIQKITADQYSFTFLNELMRQRDLTLEQLSFSARSKPELFFDLKNALSGGQLQLPDCPEAVRELRALESIRTSGGAYKISAPRNQHDDYATVLALLANRIKRARPREPFHPQLLTVANNFPASPRRSRLEQLDPADEGPSRWWRPVE